MKDSTEVTRSAPTLDDVRAVLAEVCETTRVYSVAPGPRSYSNRLWLAETDEGRLLVRIPGRTDDAEVVRASVVATRMAAEAGIPTVRFRAFAPRTLLGLPVVVQEFRPGGKASDALRRGEVELGELAATLGDWVGRLHRLRRTRFGAVTDPHGDETWAGTVRTRVGTALAGLGEQALPASRAQIESAFDTALADLVGAEPASLVHGDLYLDNVLVDRGRAGALLDFEHAHFFDRFAEFGKLNELLFEWWPGSERPFMEAYSQHFPDASVDAPRWRVGVGMYELWQLAYFQRWQPDLVPVYRERLRRWLAGRCADGGGDNGDYRHV
ncbi:MAG TPA: aminoglycoside phosphotransferase family protein [Actinophytocola sp.]|uniref:aminoglycoside phosphotransferase family protein n=1 Tax=Actinophytocola sp. TaxID=1872138 RepID=UPI002DDD4873|nr:aminoglycoside phosphotransferase family protein [Actinophytocola sp.]HEV2778228.1 aminoglycoside phosphotransferase family protein [Actinophytocola sp.]